MDPLVHKGKGVSNLSVFCRQPKSVHAFEMYMNVPPPPPPPPNAKREKVA